MFILRVLSFFLWKHIAGERFSCSSYIYLHDGISFAAWCDLTSNTRSPSIQKAEKIKVVSTYMISRKMVCRDVFCKNAIEMIIWYRQRRAISKRWSLISFIFILPLHIFDWLLSRAMLRLSLPHQYWKWRHRSDRDHSAIFTQGKLITCHYHFNIFNISFKS